VKLPAFVALPISAMVMGRTPDFRGAVYL